MFLIWKYQNENLDDSPSPGFVNHFYYRMWSSLLTPIIVGILIILNCVKISQIALLMIGL